MDEIVINNISIIRLERVLVMMCVLVNYYILKVCSPYVYRTETTHDLIR